MTEKFNLKWNDFKTNSAKSFGLFRNESYLHDVTLVSDDSIHIPAHKLVLSACSEYFKSIFQKTKQSQPIICLEGVSSHDIKNVLDYVYDGEIKIEQDNLDRFLAIAQRLRLEGLIGGEGETLENDLPQEASNHGIKYEHSLHEETFVSNENLSPKMNPPRKQTKVNNSGERNLIALASNEDYSHVKEKIQENIQKIEDGSWKCKVCGVVKTGPNKYKLMTSHIETHIEGVSYPCQLCDKTFRSKNSLTCHKSNFHK